MKRITSVMITVAVIFGMLTFCSYADEYLTDSGIGYIDGLQTIEDNPGRGIGCYYWIVANDAGSTQSYTEHPTGLSTPMYDLSAFSSGNDYEQIDYPSVKDDPGRVGGVNRDINGQTLDAIRQTFESARKKGVQCIPRFSYAWDNYVGCEPDDIEWIIRHIEQLCQVINEYKDIIIGIEGGIIGPWGEMHSSMYSSKEHSLKIVGAWLDNADESIPILCRNPSLILNYARTLDVRLMKELPLSEDHAAYRLGMYNDGYLGTNNDYGTWGVGLTREQGVKFLSGQNVRMPYGGEMAHTTVEFLSEYKSPIYEDWFVTELYDSHLSYLRNLTTNTTGLQVALTDMIFDETHVSRGMPDVSEYYGQTMQKFMLDHMGYRFVLRSALTSDTVDKGGVVRLSGSVENVGFGNLLGIVHTELILVDESGEVLPLAVDIDPKAWQSTSTVEYDLSVSVPRSAEAGEYSAYLRISAVPYAEAVGDTRAVRFANPDVYEKSLGANYIGSFTVSEEVGGVADRFAQVYIDFDDVDGHWAEDYIKDICTLGYMGGMGNGLFLPEGIATRAQFVTVLYNIEGRPDTAGLSTPFTDAQGWYTDAIRWAYGEGIVNGVSPTAFDPDGKLDRETFATMLYRYAAYKGAEVESVRGDLSKFSDGAEVSSWARTALEWANAEGYIGGMTASTVVPKGSATRAQMATILVRYEEKDEG